MLPHAIAQPALRQVYLVSWWFADFGGMERHITELAKSLRNRGVRVTVFTEMPVRRNNQYVVELRRAGIPFVSPLIPRSLVIWWQNRFPSKEGNGVHDAVSQAIGSSFLARLLRRNLERRIQHEDTPDVVHVHGWLLRQWVVTWCAGRSIPAIYTEHSTIGDWGGPQSTSAPKWITQVAEIACVSDSARQSLARWLPGRRIALHRHIVGLPDPGCGIRPSRKAWIISVARLRAEKGLDVLLRAAAQLRLQGLEFQIEIAGAGPMLAELNTLRSQLGLNDCVLFSGGCGAEAIQEKMCNADIFVLPSRTEAMPLAVLEAMSHGLAIAATSVGGIPEVISDGETGLLVAPESVEALAAALARLICDADLRAKVGTNARRHFESGPYSEAAGVASVLASYDSARNGVLAG